jgi:hypothetical protein
MYIYKGNEKGECGMYTPDVKSIAPISLPRQHPHLEEWSGRLKAMKRTK